MPPLPGEISSFYKGSITVVEPVPGIDVCPEEELSCVLFSTKLDDNTQESISVKVAPPYKLGSNVCTDVPKTYTVSEPDCLDDMNMRSGETGLVTDDFKLRVINKFVCFYDKCSTPLNEFLASLPNYLRKSSPEAILNPRVFAQSETVSTPISQPEVESIPTPSNAPALAKLEKVEKEVGERKENLYRYIGIAIAATITMGSLIASRILRKPKEEKSYQVNVGKDDEFEELLRNGNLTEEQARKRFAFVEGKYRIYFTEVIRELLGLGRGYSNPISSEQGKKLLNSGRLPEKGKHQTAQNQTIFVESDGSDIRIVGGRVVRNMTVFVSALHKQGIEPHIVLDDKSLARLRRDKDNKPAPDNKTALSIFYWKLDEMNADERRRKEEYLKKLYNQY
jgi:hypothetical protein